MGGHAAACARPSLHPPSGPGRSLQGPPWCRPALPGIPASWPIRARLRVHNLKVSQNGEVSPKSSHEASHSPYSQNGVQKSPLDFLRFPLLLAFSHKELMGLFCTQLGLYCQNDEVSPKCAPSHTRSGRTDTPTDHGSKLPSVVRSSSVLARASHGILNDLGFDCFTGDYD